MSTKTDPFLQEMLPSAEQTRPSVVVQPGAGGANSKTAAAHMLTLSELDQMPAMSTQPVIDASRNENHVAANPLHQVKAKLTVCVGTAELTVGELLNAKEQQVLRLDRTVEQPVDIMLEGQVIARGMLVAIDEYFGVRITELPQPLKT